MREQQFGVSPFATGDAINGGWGFTNLALYGASHVGILGGIIDTTNVPMVLRLDLLKTDYFGGAAYLRRKCTTRKRADVLTVSYRALR